MMYDTQIRLTIVPGTEVTGCFTYIEIVVFLMIFQLETEHG